MTWQDSAQVLGEHPTELALTASLLISIAITAAIRSVEKARPILRARFEKRRYFRGQRGDAIYKRIDEALVLLVLSLLAVMGGSSLFLHIARGLAVNTWLPFWDYAFIDTVHRTVTPGEVWFFSHITPLAGRYPPYVIGVVVGALLLYRRHYRLLVIWAGGLMGGALLQQVLKLYFERSRPVLDNPFLLEENYSFPSGHAMTSVLLYGLLAYVCSREFFKYQPIHRYLMIWGLSFFGVLVGTSRLVLGVHFPSDVLGGWSVAVVWLAVLILAAEALKGRFGPLERLRFWARRKAAR
jgi:undecaprenyl-diphosphatase